MSEKIVLKGDDAIALWKAGKDTWNQWAKENPEADVDFSDVDFSNRRKNGEPISFRKYVFPEGNVDFSGAQFGEGNVDFIAAQFGEGNVCFIGAQFGEGNVDFSGAQFGRGLVSFFDARFGKGDVSFIDAQFGKGDVNFRGAQFGEGNVNFSGAQFGEGNVNFSGAQFGEGEVRFYGADWKGGCIFDPSEVRSLKSLDFSSVSIEGDLSFGQFSTSCVIDLRHSKINRPIDLDRVDINYELESENWKKWPFHRAAKPHASTCFRRLKKLAKEADDHQRALDFYAKEMRSSYGHSLTGWKLALFFAYDKISDYGRSLLYPFLYLVLCTEVFGIIYWWKGTETTRCIYDGLTFSLGHAVPLYAGSREARTGNANALFGSIDKIPDYIHILTVGQGLICGVFLFLIALALRNHFRS